MLSLFRLGDREHLLGLLKTRPSFPRILIILFHCGDATKGCSLNFVGCGADRNYNNTTQGIP